VPLVYSTKVIHYVDSIFQHEIVGFALTGGQGYRQELLLILLQQ